MWDRPLGQLDDLTDALDIFDSVYKYDLVDSPEKLYDKLYEIVDVIADDLSKGKINREFIRSL